MRAQITFATINPDMLPKIEMFLETVGNGTFNGNGWKVETPVPQPIIKTLREFLFDDWYWSGLV
ncbi:MAG: hypothetical protein Aurels2KO_56990 [Aureliella sp.]